ncbi:hypothetical protein CCHR01_19843 [Colletotrichum chrysophilum]|uniref:Uncharacterized protein n=1 Tax=Colletotrichum chrysophilum TaxID=1836956 RepID=A0AAD8ZYZ0_9PEZI|nr:hypothetical protein CCHR01_19843 [Colletotrichum chrysophilum]
MTLDAGAWLSAALRQLRTCSWPCLTVTHTLLTSIPIIVIIYPIHLISSHLIPSSHPISLVRFPGNSVTAHMAHSSPRAPLPIQDKVDSGKKKVSGWCV